MYYLNIILLFSKRKGLDMINKSYENFTSVDPAFPISYHTENLVEDNSLCVPLHWHEHIEMLLVKHGPLTVYINNHPITAEKDNIIVINAGLLHTIPERAPGVVYQCLIPHKTFCDQFSIPVEDLTLQSLIQDDSVIGIFKHIMQELSTKAPFYRASVQSLTLSLLVLLAREYQISEAPYMSSSSTAKNNIAKHIISYLMKHFKDNITIEEICDHIGFSKHYVCHSFKDTTGYTIIEYLNILRCNNAKNLLLSGKCNISQCAAESGFHNLSYFTKTYQKYVYELPSDTLRKSERKKSSS